MDQGSAMVCGRLSRDPQFFGEGDKQRAVFSIAYNRGTGEKRKANFIDAIAWGKRADIMRDFSQGMGIFVTGDLEQDTFETKDGQKRSRVQVNVNSITATTSTRKPDGEGGGSRGNAGSNAGSNASGESAQIPF